MDGVQDEIAALSEEARNEMVPSKSKDKYEKEYTKYKNWRELKNRANPEDQDVLLTYLKELSERLAPSTLWSIYLMLKMMVQNKERFNISAFKELLAFIKIKNEGYEPKQSKTLTSEEVQEFIENAPDDAYLALKVVLRPSSVPSDRFFLQFINGQCKQVMGINKITKVPKLIAHYLKLPDPELYTEHCARRTSATIDVEEGLHSQALRREYDKNEKKTSNLIAQSINLPSTSTLNNNVHSLPSTSRKSLKENRRPMEKFNNNSNTSKSNNNDMDFTGAELDELFSSDKDMPLISNQDLHFSDAEMNEHFTTGLQVTSHASTEKYEKNNTNAVEIFKN